MSTLLILNKYVYITEITINLHIFVVHITGSYDRFWCVAFFQGKM